MARNKFDVDERLETPFDFRHLKRVGVYIGKHKWKMLLALLLSALASVTSLAVPKSPRPSWTSLCRRKTLTCC